MNTHRIYKIREDGHVMGPPVELENVTETEAIAAAGQLVDEVAVELWKGASLVLRLRAKE